MNPRTSDLEASTLPRNHRGRIVYSINIYLNFDIGSSRCLVSHIPDKCKHFAILTPFCIVSKLVRINSLNMSLTKDMKWKKKNRKNYVHNTPWKKNHRKINTLEEIEILKADSSKYLLNDVISGQNDPIYKLLPTSVIWNPRSTAQAKQQTKIQNFKN